MSSIDIRDSKEIIVDKETRDIKGRHRTDLQITDVQIKEDICNRKKDVLKNHSPEELISIFENLGVKKFRAKQVYGWVMKNISDFDEMNNIPKALRETLKDKFDIGNLKILVKKSSKVDSSSKYLFELEDGESVESVAMEYEDRLTVCVSSQVGCKMGCSFCASTIGGLVRNLEPWEILDQVLKIQYDLQKRVSNIVMMGSGEPLDNYDNVVKFLKLANHKDGLNIGYRHFTISTCGVVPKIYKLADEGLPINLALSLHSPFDEERKDIMPIARAYSIEENITACKYFISVTNRRVTFEYSLIDGINSSDKHAEALARLLRGMLCHVNLIPINSVRESGYKRPSKGYIYRFKDRLTKLGINATIRESMGSDIEGACGQLRRSMTNK